MFLLIFMGILLFTNNLAIANESIENYQNVIFFNDFNINSLMKATEENNAKAISILMKSGYDVNAVNNAKVSSLHIAAKNNSIEALEELLKYSPKVNPQDEEGFTPLMRACMFENDDIVQILIKHKASLWTKNNFGDTSLVLATKSDCLGCIISILANTTKTVKNFDLITQEVNKAITVATKKEADLFVDLLKTFLKSKKEFMELEVVKKYLKEEYNITQEESKKKVEIRKRTILFLDAKKISQKNFKKLKNVID